VTSEQHQEPGKPSHEKTVRHEPDKRQPSPSSSVGKWWVGTSTNTKIVLVVVVVLVVAWLLGEALQRRDEAQRQESSSGDSTDVLLQRARSYASEEESRFNAMSPDEHYHQAELAQSRGSYDDMIRHLDALEGTPLAAKGRSLREKQQQNQRQRDIAIRQRREQQEKAPQDAGELARLSESLWLIDSGRHEKSAYRKLLAVVRERFPDHSYTNISDQATHAAKRLCAQQGKNADVFSALVFIKGATDGLSKTQLDRLQPNNPPSTLLLVWIGNGCPRF
jgi:cytoskeletal protein RodZ